MAQIKDLIVLGAARILNKIYASEFIGKLTGNADTATKATQDESGNNIKSSYASSISISDHTITLKNKNGTSLGTVTVPDTNTWRGIQDNLTSTSTTDSLSANQGRLLANGSARDNTKLPLAGGTMSGPIHFNSNSLPEFDGSVPHLVGIESSAGSGSLKWQKASEVSEGYATSSGNDTTATALTTSTG